VYITISDGSLPSNVGGGANVRNILRRIFAITQKHGWFKKLQMDGLLHLFKLTRNDFSQLYGPSKEYNSFPNILEIEF
jgi:alanyl-tRNA synthetase